MAKFRSWQDFFGTYEGSHDGRRARVRISDTKADSPVPLFHIRFDDLDRGASFAGLHRQPPRENLGHVLSDVVLSGVNGTQGDKQWREFLLHTWDTRYLSAISLYRGRPYGCSYERTR